MDKITELIELLYSDKMILNQKRSINDVEDFLVRAQQINDLMERSIFDNHFMDSLELNTPYSEIEKCYLFILESILKRVSSVSSLHSKKFHVIVADGIGIESTNINDDAIIILAWPIIKFIDLLNTNALNSKDFDSYYHDCLLVLHVYQLKFKEKKDVHLYESLYDISTVDATAFQITMYIRQIQTIFILGHEIGHLINPNLSGLEGEKAADAMGYKILFDYCQNNRVIAQFLCIGIMLLFSYYTLLDISMKSTKQEMIATRDNWLNRYDDILSKMEQIDLNERQIELISGYDKICSVLDRICIEIIEGS